MTYSEFIEKQSTIYNQIRDHGEKALTEGIKPDKAVHEEHAGLLISFRHPVEMMEKLEIFSEKIAAVVPAVSFGVSNAHTTISDYNVASKNHIKLESDETKLICNRFSMAITEAIHENENSIPLEINFTGFIYNQTTVIATGTPNKAVINLVNEIRQSVEKIGISLRMPWGMHITTNRFSDEKSADELVEFFQLMERSPVLGLSVPYCIDLSYFEINSTQETLHLIDRFMLSN